MLDLVRLISVYLALPVPDYLPLPFQTSLSKICPLFLYFWTHTVDCDMAIKFAHEKRRQAVAKLTS